MAYLLGSFGTMARTQTEQHKMQQALHKAGAQDIESLLLPHGVLYTGKNPKHTRAYNDIIPIGKDGGILVGKLFDRDTYKPFSADDALAMNYAHKSVFLYQHFWGRFIGALYNQAEHALSLVRDPLGLSTLFYCENPGGTIFSTDISLIYEVLETKPSLDLSFFAEYITNTNQALPTTPFKEIKELLPGMALTIDAQGKITQQFMWDIAHLRGSFIADEREMEDRLLEVLKSCVKAWTYDLDGICVELSGGLDSSATLITLREVLPADKKLIAVNFIDSKTPSSNENEYAQEVADLCEIPLQLLDWHDIPLLAQLPSGWLPNRPSTLLLSRASAEQLYELAVSHGCHDIFNGQGGDHVFQAPAPQNALADYWLDRGLKGAMKPLAHISAAHRTSWSLVAYESAQAVMGYYRRKHTQSNTLTPFLAPDYASAMPKQDFYLKEPLTKFYPAKAAQIESLSHAVSYADRDQRFGQTVMSHPLLSLPLVELALKIPVYQSFNDTYDRIFFRRAATKMKQSKALWRTLKGQTTSTMSKSCIKEADQITALLLEGTLVKSGIINRPWLTDELIKMRHGKADNLWPLLHLITSQLWLNQWKL